MSYAMQIKVSKWHGVTGTSTGKWRATQLTEDKTHVYISSAFETEEAAARAYDRGAIAVRGREVANLNFPLEEYSAEVSWCYEIALSFALWGCRLAIPAILMDDCISQ